ncbi:MAG: CinA family nicotinamide mononucleotide deamidase-related protein [Planctomycetota bacterium]|jgi:nicotinamide-nucleotide amidase
MPVPNPKAEILLVGSELTDGTIRDTNGAHISKTLTEIGLTVHCIRIVPDTLTDIIVAIKEAAADSNLLVVAGGIGPTDDDMTRRAAAEAVGKKLARDGKSENAIRARFNEMNRKMPEINLRQADAPEGAEIVPNRHGTAPGFVLNIGNTPAVFIPGVPSECRLMLESLLPRIRELTGEVTPECTRRILTIGAGESAIQEKCADLFSRYSNSTVRLCAKDFAIEITLKAPSGLSQEMDSLTHDIAGRLGSSVVSTKGENLQEIVYSLLSERKRTLATAESCTGGLVGDLLTGVSGISEIYLAGYVTYSNEAKIRDLGVSRETIGRFGAVAVETAEEMAEGARNRTGADYAVSTTGIAGPTGGTEEKPVGTVCFAVAGPERTVSRKLWIPGGRNDVKRRAANTALNFLRLELLRETRPE